MSRNRVLASIVEHGPSTMGELTEALSLSWSTVRYHLQRLAIEGAVRDCENSWPRRFDLAARAGAAPLPTVGERWLAARRDGEVLVLDRGRAACAGMPYQVFFGKGRAPQAKRVCAQCPVAVACLDFAIRTGTEYGVFGGTSPGERRRLARTLDGYRSVGVAELTET